VLNLRFAEYLRRVREQCYITKPNNEESRVAKKRGEARAPLWSMSLACNSSTMMKIYDCKRVFQLPEFD